MTKPPSAPLRSAAFNSESESARLLGRVARRDVTAFAQLYDQFSPVLFSLVVRIVGARPAAEEVLTESFEFVWNHAGEFRPAADSPFSWLTALVRRRALEWLKTRRGPSSVPLLRAPGLIRAVGSYSKSTSAPEWAARPSFDPVTEQVSEAAELAYFGGLSQAGIAQTLHCSVASIPVRLRQELLEFKVVRTLTEPSPWPHASVSFLTQWDAQTVSRAESADGLRALGRSTDCVKVLSLEGRLEWMNDSGLRMMELDDFSKVEGENWLSFWKDQTSHASAERTLELARAGRASHFTGYCATGRGTTKCWVVIVSPILTSTGHAHRIFSVSRDLTPPWNAPLG